MEKLPYSQIQKGTLLVATPDIDSGLFFRSVLLVCEHTPSGSFGLVINKTFDLDLPTEIIDLETVNNPHVGLRAGGPVQTNQMMLLHTSPQIPQQTLQICDDVFLGGDLQFLQKMITKEDGPHVRLCFGYTGWGSGQLEREFLDGHWFLFPATKELLFDISSEDIWSHILREMGGKYASLSMMPEDLSLN